jgi:hypothetical protein
MVGHLVPAELPSGSLATLLETFEIVTQRLEAMQEFRATPSSEVRNVWNQYHTTLLVEWFPLVSGALKGDILSLLTSGPNKVSVFALIHDLVRTGQDTFSVKQLLKDAYSCALPRKGDPLDGRTSVAILTFLVNVMRCMSSLDEAGAAFKADLARHLKVFFWTRTKKAGAAPDREIWGPFSSLPSSSSSSSVGRELQAVLVQLLELTDFLCNPDLVEAVLRTVVRPECLDDACFDLLQVCRAAVLSAGAVPDQENTIVSFLATWVCHFSPVSRSPEFLARFARDVFSVVSDLGCTGQFLRTCLKWLERSDLKGSSLIGLFSLWAESSECGGVSSPFVHHLECAADTLSNTMKAEWERLLTCPHLGNNGAFVGQYFSAQTKIDILLSRMHTVLVGFFDILPADTRSFIRDTYSQLQDKLRAVDYERSETVRRYLAVTSS